MNDPLPVNGGSFSPSAGALQIEDDVLAAPPNSRYPGPLQYGSDLCRRRFQRLRLLPQPDRLNRVARDVLVEPAGYGFDFRKFGHSLDSTASRLGSGGTNTPLRRQERNL